MKVLVMNASEKNRNLSTIDKIHSKGNSVDGSVVNGLRQSMFFDLVLDKPSGFKIFCEPETIHYKKIKKIYFEYSNFLIRS